LSSYTFPEIATRPAAEPKTVYTIANGDLRLTTNVKTWAMQQQVEGEFAAAVESLGWNVQRAHDVNPVTGHGFIDNQRRGMEVFKNVPTDAPLVVTLHDLNAAARLATHVLMLWGDGRTLAGPAVDILQPELLSDLFATPVSRVEVDGEGFFHVHGEVAVDSRSKLPSCPSS